MPVIARLAVVIENILAINIHTLNISPKLPHRLNRDICSEYRSWWTHVCPRISRGIHAAKLDAPQGLPSSVLGIVDHNRHHQLTAQTRDAPAPKPPPARPPPTRSNRHRSWRAPSPECNSGP